MSKSPVRIHDEVKCDRHGNGKVITADPTVLFEGQRVARAGDTVRYKDGLEKKIETGNACVVVNDQRLALVGDSAESGGTLKTGASTIHVDEGEPFVFIGSNVEFGENVSFISTKDSDDSGILIDLLEGAALIIGGIPGDELGAGEIMQIAGYKVTKHALKRMAERKVSKEAVEDALKNPLKVSPVKYDQRGLPSQKYTGKGADVAINPENKNIVSVNPVSTKRVNKLTQTSSKGE